MSDPVPPHIPKDVQETPYQQQYYAQAKGASVHQNPLQPGAAHSHDFQRQEGIYTGHHQNSAYIQYSQPNAPSISYQQPPQNRIYSNEEWSSPSVPYPHPNVPSYPYQQSEDTPTIVENPPVVPSQNGAHQYISRRQQSEQYTSYQHHGQPPESYWPRQRYPQQPTYPDGFHRVVDASHHSRAHEAPQQFHGAPNHAALSGGNATTGMRVEEQKRYDGGLSAKAAGKRKAVDNDRPGESSSGTMKRFRSNASTQQVLMAPPPVSHANFNAIGGMRAPSRSPYFEMTGMQFNLNDQFEASGTQSHQNLPSTQNGSSTLRSQVPRGYYDQNNVHPQGWQARNAHYKHPSVPSQSVQQSAQASPVVDRYGGRNQHSSRRVLIFQSVSLLRELLRTHTKGERGDCYGILNGRHIVLIRVVHPGRPGSIQDTGIAYHDSPMGIIRIIRDPREMAHVHCIAVDQLKATLKANRHRERRSHTENGPHGFQQSPDHSSRPSGSSLPTPARTPAEPDAALHLNKGSNSFAPSAGYFPHSSGQALPTPVRTPDDAVPNGDPPTAGYFAGPSFPTLARTSVQPVPIQPPPSIPLTNTLPVDNFWSAAPVQSESPRVRTADSGEDEPRVSISLVDRPTTLLPDERHVESVGEEAKEETNGDIMDTPQYQEFILEQPGVSTSATFNGSQSSEDYFSRPSGQILPTPVRTPVQPDAGLQLQNDLQQSAGYLVIPSAHTPPTSAHASVQSTTVQAPPPVPDIIDDARSTAPAPAESSVVQNEDSGEDEPQLPPSPVPRPTALLTDEKHAPIAGGRVKQEEEPSLLECVLGVVITDMPWYKEYNASAHEEQPVASTSATSAEVPSTTDDDGAADDQEYHRVYTEFMVDDDEEDDGDGNGDSLFGSPP
ncbi:hypothetical protein EDD18DRAFT_180413 [Armillaria luteobubalina]|uniref:Uncharacterized protein n=1 Tax=Armillaria luteobubalina TaxID=153913 RepID=A0AA39Q5Y5_9AGAR|nr:hypothetical protein EDD18DRAFT_180413 [Armillaria luteobubalina]